jgi:uncharacterized repeat protein (TIGR01451 family)
MCATAQTLTVVPSASQVTVGGTLTYTIGVTNTTGETISQLLVTEILPTSAQLLFATNEFGTTSNGFGTVVFRVSTFSNNTAVFMTTTVSPTNTTTMTNITFVATNFFTAFTNISTNIITTPIFSGQSDLSVAIKFPATQVLTNDLVTYSLAVTNNGSNSVSGVILSNVVPPDVKIISVTPPNTSSASNTLIFNIGTLGGKGFKIYQVGVEPTNAGLHTFTATVSGTGTLDTNSLNNSTSANINVIEGLSTNFIVSGFSAQVFNPQTGLVEQTVNLANIGTNASASTRVNILGFTNWVYNAAGTNNGHPFILFSGTLDGGANTNLNLKYFIPSKSPVANPTASAIEVPFFNPPLPAGSNVTLTRTNLTLAPGIVLIEFPSTLNRQYTIAYMDGGVGSNWMVVQPRVTAPGSRVQWIDDGPPATISKPIGGSRFYRAIAN